MLDPFGDDGGGHGIASGKCTVSVSFSFHVVWSVVATMRESNGYNHSSRLDSGTDVVSPYRARTGGSGLGKLGSVLRSMAPCFPFCSLALCLSLTIFRSTLDHER